MTVVAIANIQDDVHSSDSIAIDEDNFFDLAPSTVEANGADFTSIADSIRRHVFENGRRYHAKHWQGRYVLPNDETEQKRLNLLHEIGRVLLGGRLHIADQLPFPLRNVLDCGTGTGIWAMDFAQAYPEAQVYGVDLSPIQPQWVPENCTFQVDDLEQPWLWRKRFDYIHSADLSQSIRDWKKYVKQIFDNLRPGGLVEFLESRPGWRSDDESVPRGGWIEKYESEFARACAQVGLKDAAPEIPRLMQEVGFTDVQVTLKKMPIGYWPKDPKMKELGGYGIAQCSEAVKSYGLALFTRELGMTQEEAEELAKNAFKECMKKGVHSYVQQMYVTGKKPQ